MTLKQTLVTNLSESIAIKQSMLSNKSFLKQFSDAAEALIQCYERGNKLFVAGNGGSAADAQHLVAEFVSKLSCDRNPLPAESLTVDTSILTAIGNDYGFEKIYSRQILANVKQDDIFLAITTSGNSENIIEALKTCCTKSIKSILLSAGSGGQAISFADYPVLVPSNVTSRIQEAHIVVEHSFCELVERKFME